MGFRRVLRSAFPHLRIDERVTSDDVPEHTFEQVARYIETQGAPAAIYNVAGANRGVAKALERAGVGETTMFVGHELTPPSRALLESGLMDYVISHDFERELETAMRWIADHRQGVRTEPSPSPVLVHALQLRALSPGVDNDDEHLPGNSLTSTTPELPTFVRRLGCRDHTGDRSEEDLAPLESVLGARDRIAKSPREVPRTARFQRYDSSSSASSMPTQPPVQHLLRTANKTRTCTPNPTPRAACRGSPLSMASTVIHHPVLRRPITLAPRCSGAPWLISVPVRLRLAEPARIGVPQGVGAAHARKVSA